LVLPREAVDRLLALHPSLHQRVSAILGRGLEHAVRLVEGRKVRPGEIVVLEGWTSREERRTFGEALAEALGGELGRHVPIVTVASRGAASAAMVREDRPDAVVAADDPQGGTLRQRLAAELAARSAQAPAVVVELDADLAGPELGLVNLADT